MKDELKLKREQLVEKEDRFNILVKKAEKETLSAEEKTELDTLEKEMQALEVEIKSLEDRESRTAKIAARKMAAENRAVGVVQDDEAEIKELNKIAKRYKISNAVKLIQARKEINGVEREMYDEAAKEAKDAGADSLIGNVAIPSRLIKIGKSNTRAALSVGTEGADVVFTDYAGLIPILNPDPAVVAMGISVYQGLRGNLQWARHTTDVAFSWETETSDVDETTPAFDNVSISPKRVGGFTDVTMQMLKQSVFVLEPWLRGIIERRYNLTVDYAVLNGSGSGNEPTGIFNASGVNVLSTGSGSANNMTYPALLSMRRDTQVAKARNGRAGWLTNAYGEFALANTPRQASGVEGNFILNPGTRQLFGQPFAVSEVIKSDYSEGGQTDLCGIVYSPNWGGAIFGTWGGMDLLVDPYTQAKAGTVRFVVNCFMDTDIEQPAEFAICKDWDASDLPALT